MVRILPLLRPSRQRNLLAQPFVPACPFSIDPIVVTGSANFSDASTNSNDENMLIIRGNRRVADIYFTEFNRLFNHYYLRAVLEDKKAAASDNKVTASELFLDETARSG